MNRIPVRSISASFATGATLSVIAVGSLGSLVAAVPSGAFAQGVEQHPLGEHPAVIVKRHSASEGYDYASKFYPHPAWLYWSAEPPRQLSEHPAVIGYRRYLEQPSAAVAAPTSTEERRQGE